MAREAQGGPERLREAQGGQGRPREAQGRPGRPREAVFLRIVHGLPFASEGAAEFSAYK